MAIRNPDADFFAALADLGGGNLDDNCAKAANGGGGVQARLGNLKWSESAWWAREDSNLQPSGYEPLALTIELRARAIPARAMATPSDII